jgi:hypothetical protein
MGRSAILGEQRNNYFNDVACGKGVVGDYTFAITKSGMLCEFNNRRLLDKWVDLKVIFGATAVSAAKHITHNHFALFVSRRQTERIVSVSGLTSLSLGATTESSDASTHRPCNLCQHCRDRTS